MEGCSSFFLPRLVGLTRASDWVITARVFTPREEENSGLFTRVLPAERVLPEAMELARDLAVNVSAQPSCATLF